ncbi:MAG: tyrosine-type recombinase/integrase [Gammaproteobacteria bacterium]|nr:tyrosine-type recombinase/integrase [Gammaproteobacteria bacterium]
MAKRSGLTDLECRNAKAKEKPYKLADERGLYLLVNPNGSKWWRLRYTWQGKDQLLSLGVYPEVPLAGRKLTATEREAGKPDRIKGARELRDEARELLAAGVNPSHQKQQAREALAAITADAFEAVAREWYGHKCATWTATQAEKVLRRLEGELFPWIGSKAVREITPPELLACLRRTAARGAVDTAHRTRQDASMIFRYAIASGRAERDPAADVRGALPAIRKKHYATITEPRAVGELMRAIQGASGTFPTLCAVRLAPLLFVRPGELRHAEWSEFDLHAAEWRIPAAKMKMRAPHIVPLPVQAVAILRELHPLTGTGRWCFPGERSRQQPISEATINAMLRRMGYAKDQMTGHGFRAMASTMLHEQGWLHEAIERQLAHGHRDQVSAAYNHSEHLPLRRKMMQAWADYLDKLREGGNVTALRQRA